MFSKSLKQRFHAALAARMDADQVTFIAPALDEVLSESFRAPLPVLRGREVVPIQPGQDGKNRWVARQKTGTGQAKFMAASAGAKDFNRTDVYKEEVAFPYRTLGIACSYNQDELAAAAAGDEPLDVDRMIEARDACLRLMDHTLAFGDADLGLEGFVNNALITPTTLPNGSWLADGVDPRDVLEDWGYLLGLMRTRSKDTYQVTAVAMSTTIHAKLSHLPVGTDDNQTSVLRQMQINNPEVRIVPWYKLDQANAGGNGPRMMLFQDSPLVVRARISAEPSPTPPQADALNFDVYWRARMSGVGMINPLGVLSTDFVAS